VVGAEHQNRLLTIVRSGSSSAVFAFNVSTYPPVNLSDLHIESVVPIDESFLIDCSGGYGISSHQFTILTGNEQIVYYYYPDEETCKSKSNFERVLKKLIQGESLLDSSLHEVTNMNHSAIFRVFKRTSWGFRVDRALQESGSHRDQP
jgi:Type II inositol 1,4,5-trisphosphate 5-phosphatase PH domain